MLDEMKFPIDEAQFTQREVLRVIDLPATTLNTWIKRNLLAAFEFERDFRSDDERLEDLAHGVDPGPRGLRVYKVFQHDPSVRRIRLYSILDTLCLAGIKAVLDANIEIRFAHQFPIVLCDWWTNRQLFNLGRHSWSKEPIILYIDEGRLMCLPAPTPYLRLIGEDATPEVEANAVGICGGNPHRVEKHDLLRAMRDAQLSSVTVIDWPTVEEHVIDGLKRIIGVQGYRSWRTEKGK